MGAMSPSSLRCASFTSGSSIAFAIPGIKHKIGSKEERVEQRIVQIHAPVCVVAIRFDGKVKCPLVQ